MAASPIQLPAFPPAGPWDAYVLFILWLPFIIRLLFLAKPMRAVINKLSPHAGWAMKQLRTLPVKGMGLLVFNEIFAFLIPPLLVFGLRMFIDPIGWQSWSEVTNLGGTLLLMALFFWIAMDFYRVARVRRMLSAVLRQDVTKLRKVADAGLRARAWLRKVSGREKNKPVTKDEVNESGKIVVKNSLKVWAGRALLTRKLTPAGLLSSVAMGAAIEVGRIGAGKFSDVVDKKLQQEFEERTNTQSKSLVLLFIRDMAMGIFPLFILAAVPWLVG
ncbi:MAG: hypothetical protein ACPH8S_05615 [Poseidonia sp.]